MKLDLQFSACSSLRHHALRVLKWKSIVRAKQGLNQGVISIIIHCVSPKLSGRDRRQVECTPGVYLQWSPSQGVMGAKWYWRIFLRRATKLKHHVSLESRSLRGVCARSAHEAGKALLSMMALLPGRRDGGSVLTVLSKAWHTLCILTVPRMQAKKHMIMAQPAGRQ